MRARQPLGQVVEVDGPIILANLFDGAQGQVVAHADGISSFEQPGDLLAVEAGATTIVARVLKIGFAEPRNVAHVRDLASSEPLRQVRAQVIGSLMRRNGELQFQVRDSRLPVLGAQLVPLSAEEIAATLRPSGCNNATTIALGTDVRNPSVVVQANVDTLLACHMAVLGGTGQGKTNFVAYLAQQFAELPKSRIVIFDVNGEYSWAFRGREKDVRRTVIGPKITGLSGDNVPASSMKIPYYALGHHGLMRLLLPSERAQSPSLRFAIEHLPYVEYVGDGAKPYGSSGDAVFFDDCNTSDATEAFAGLEEIRRKRNPAGHWPHMRALACLAADFYCIQMDARNCYRRNSFQYSHISSLVTRIHSLLFDDRFQSVVDPSGGAGIGPSCEDQPKLDLRRETNALSETIFGTARPQEGNWRVHIVDFSALAPDLMPFVLGSLLEMFAETLFQRGPGGTHPTLLVLEEAHHYLRQLPGIEENGSPSRAYERLAKEGRKFGLGLLLSTQRPSELSPTVLAQMGTWVTFRLSSEVDQRAVAAATDAVAGSTISQLSGLGRGEAIAFGSAIPLPVRLAVRRPHPEPASSDPAFAKEWA